MVAIKAGANPSATSRRLIMTALALPLVWGADPARAQVACGDTIPDDTTPPGNQASLDGNLACPAPGPALTIIGPVTVDLNGFTISCEAAITGIRVQGVNAKIRNGFVDGCQDGVDVGGEGRHLLLKLTVQSSQNQAGDRGFRVRSDHNQLVNNHADHFNGEGLRIEGDDNRVVNNRATGTTNEGFRINGSDNHIIDNWATENLSHGFRVGGNNNQLVNNHAEDNKVQVDDAVAGGEGFRLDGSGNRLVNNAAINNNDEGFRIRDGQNNILINNRAEANGESDDEAGIRIQEDDNTLRNNFFINNFSDGILVKEGSENNTITHNVATGNRGIDLVDENLDCDDNQWLKNRFGTKSQDCID